jgi:hypothetical protein
MILTQSFQNYNANRTTRTENGMKARATSDSAVLDLFGRAGSSRGVDLSSLFHKSYVEDKDLTTRLLLWLRDIREGAGERQQFRSLIQELDSVDPEQSRRLISKIPELGRWDDLLYFKNPKTRKEAFDFIYKGLMDGNSLCAKWMPRKGPIAVELTQHFKMTPRQYRKMLVRLSKVVETDMCAKEWDKINFSHVPSVASSRYQKAFMRNAEANYLSYIENLKTNKSGVKINASAIFPHDIVKSLSSGNPEVASQQWKALPNYVGNASILPVVDVSGSMGVIRTNYKQIQPIEVAVALGLYLSEKNQSAFKDLFITFSHNPEAVIVKGDLQQRVKQMSSADWGYNTDLHRVFDLILSVAIENNISQNDMPETILILSDMQFDEATTWDHTAVQMISHKYIEAGYKVPKVVFWNLNGKYENTPVKVLETGVSIISGYSPSIMKAILSDSLEVFSPINVMRETLMSSRYCY